MTPYTAPSTAQPAALSVTPAERPLTTQPTEHASIHQPDPAIMPLQHEPLHDDRPRPPNRMAVRDARDIRARVDARPCALGDSCGDTPCPACGETLDHARANAHANAHDEADHAGDCAARDAGRDPPICVGDVPPQREPLQRRSRGAACGDVHDHHHAARPAQHRLPRDRQQRNRRRLPGPTTATGASSPGPLSTRCSCLAFLGEAS